MKRSTLLLTALAFALWAVPVFAQGKSSTAPGHLGGGMGHGSSMGAGPKTRTGSTGGGGGHSNIISSTNLPKPLQSDTKLAQKLEGILGVSSLAALQTDANGFKTFGQFVAAVHVWNNVLKTGGCKTNTPPGCTFQDVKNTLFNGGTKQVKSLGSAIHKLDPTADSKTEANTGTGEANEDLKGS